MRSGEIREYTYVVVIVVLAIALVVAVLLGAWGLQLWGEEVNYDRLATLGNAISGPATFLAFGVAVIAILIDRIQRRREEQRTADEKATAVLFWFSVQLVKYDDGRPDTYRWIVEVENGTSSPVFEWRIVVEGHPGAGICSHKKHPLLPGRNKFNVDLANTAPGAMPQGTMSFLDRHDRLWQRAIRGDLTRQKPGTELCEHH